ncbi:uncharacterized protein LOC130621626 [Hydractinia symbiolongicarpus]|uniref:uncharacterized protein LOC130621626 n=1 Tax=Hydractinia symbiolongicarpus TaxID=13093 RepID=UPI00255197B4|nr:uncharacterized protein LOC130621626 [Hydractinia symbiolongicarpus]
MRNFDIVKESLLYNRVLLHYTIFIKYPLYLISQVGLVISRFFTMCSNVLNVMAIVLLVKNVQLIQVRLADLKIAQCTFTEYDISTPLYLATPRIPALKTVALLPFTKQKIIAYFLSFKSDNWLIKPYVECLNGNSGETFFPNSYYFSFSHETNVVFVICSNKYKVLFKVFTEKSDIVSHLYLKTIGISVP